MWETQLPAPMHPCVLHTNFAPPASTGGRSSPPAACPRVPCPSPSSRSCVPPGHENPVRPTRDRPHGTYSTMSLTGTFSNRPSSVLTGTAQPVSACETRSATRSRVSNPPGTNTRGVGSLPCFTFPSGTVATKMRLSSVLLNLGWSFSWTMKVMSAGMMFGP